MLFEYRGNRYPEYIRQGNACQYIAPAALHFCRGEGLDVGAGRWPLPGAKPVDLTNGHNAMSLPEGQYDFIFSSHCLEHIEDADAALAHWKSRIKPGGVLFLYLPHPDMEYWRPENCKKHVHSWSPLQMVRRVMWAGFENVINSERDMYWSFSVVGFVPK